MNFLKNLALLCYYKSIYSRSSPICFLKKQIEEYKNKIDYSLNKLKSIKKLHNI